MAEVATLNNKRLGKYVFKGSLGKGSFGSVDLTVDTETHKYFACKVISKKCLNTEQLQIKFETEIRVLQQLHHPYIIELTDLLKDDDNYYVFMEFCPKGELFQTIIEHHHLNEQQAKGYIKQIFEALQFIHAQGIAHRDLKPENILFDQLGNIRISDFGLSRFVGRNGLVETACGSPCYASPECISGKPYDARKSDIWSCGVVLFAMVTGQLPWTKRNQFQLFEQIRSAQFSIPEFLSDNCKDLIKRLMEPDMDKRITIDEALEHPFLQKAPISLMPPRTHGCSLSLRMIDNFFTREDSVKEIEITGQPMRKCISVGSTNINGELKKIADSSDYEEDRHQEQDGRKIDPNKMVEGQHCEARVRPPRPPNSQGLRCSFRRRVGKSKKVQLVPTIVTPRHSARQRHSI